MRYIMKCIIYDTRIIYRPWFFYYYDILRDIMIYYLLIYKVNDDLSKKMLNSQY